MKKNKNNGHRPHRHSIQQRQPLTPFRNQHTNDSRYVNNRSHTNNSSSHGDQNHNVNAAREFQHNQQKASSIQRFYNAPSHTTTSTTTTSNNNSSVGQGFRTNAASGGNGNDMDDNPSVGRQSTLAQTNPALLYTVENITPNGPDLYHCKLVDRMYDNDADGDEEEEEVLREGQVAARSGPKIPEEHLSVHDTCNQHHVPAHALFSLSNIGSLASYASPGSILIFDIDDTLVKRRHYDSSLLSSTGTSMLHQYLQSSACDSMSFETKQNYVNLLGTVLRDFVLAEPDTAAVVKELQARGCYVFALTARSSSMSSITTQSLNKLGIDFTTSLPPTMPNHAIEHQTGAAVIGGVIYCNDCPKGFVFQKFLSMQWISFPVIHSCGTSTCQNDPGCTKANQIVTSTAKQAAHHKDLACPERPVWFIDDSFPMLQSMLDQWQGQAEKQLEFYNSLSPTLQQQMPCQGKLALVCCHYTHPTNYTLNPAANPARIDDQALLERVIAVQISHFIQTQEILSDYDTLIKLGYTPAPGQVTQPQ